MSDKRWKIEHDEMFEDDLVYECPDCEWATAVIEGDIASNEYFFCPKCGIQLAPPLDEEKFINREMDETGFDQDEMDRMCIECAECANCGCK